MKYWDTVRDIVLASITADDLLTEIIWTSIDFRAWISKDVYSYGM